MKFGLLLWQTGISAAVQATLEIEHPISHMRTVLVDTVTFLQHSGGDTVTVSEVHDMHNKINIILDKAVTKCVSNAAHIFAPLFTSVYRHCEVWALQFPFLNIIEDTSSIEAFLYGLLSGIWCRFHNNLWLVTILEFNGRWEAKTGFQFDIQKWSMSDYGSTPWADKPELIYNLRVIRKVRNHLVVDRHSSRI